MTVLSGCCLLLWMSTAACQASRHAPNSPTARPLSLGVGANPGQTAISTLSPSPATVPPDTPTPVFTPTPTLPPLPKAGASLAPCSLPGLVRPTLPATIPAYAELDPTTGLHMTGQFQEIDALAYRLKVSGRVDYPRSFTLDELRCLPRIQAKCALICPGFFEDFPTFAGVPLAYVLSLAGVQNGAQEVEMIGIDGYRTAVDLNAALDVQNFLAYEWRDEPLPVLHGFPLRAVFPALQGNKWVKWLDEIIVN